jgi:hypothetical protein
MSRNPNLLEVKEIDDEVEFFGLVAGEDAKLGVMLFDRVRTKEKLRQKGQF